MTIPNQAPSGVWGEQKERSEATQGPAAQAGPQVDKRGILRSSITPNLDLFDLRPDPKKQTLKEVGVLVLPPTSRVWGFPEVRSQTSMRSREAWTEPKKKKDGEMVPQVSPIELSPNREALESTTQVVNTQNVERIPEVTPHRVQPHGGTVGTSYPIGPIMKVKYFRLNVVFESSVTALWALVYVPDGLPIGRLNVT